LSTFETYSISEAAKILKFRPSYIKFLIAVGELDYFLPPGRTQKRIPHKSIEILITNNTFNSKELNNDQTNPEDH
jgi:hypothetical protein